MYIHNLLFFAMEHDPFAALSVEQGPVDDDFVHPLQLRIPEFFEACFPGEPKKSRVKRMTYARRHCQYKNEYFERVTMKYKEWYVLNPAAIPAKYRKDINANVYVHKDFMTLVVGPSVEYRRR